ncbi:MAG TPA: YCF48-related protein [Dongiaceae bacterium]|nr:YCF48-related protein [Dongiaceae bacterium]
MHYCRKILVTAICLVLVLYPLTVLSAEFVDALDLPAKMSPLAGHSMLTDVARAGTRMVVAGTRGHILLSDDGGQNWRQASVPVSSDLTAIYFPDSNHGWAVGHDGVVLRSTDGGSSWVRQLDGRQLGTLMSNYYSALVAASPDDELYASLLDESQRMITEGADKPFLDVWFENEKRGYIVGAFNLIFRTDDGGQHWEPQQHLVDNPSAFHLNAITQAGAELFLAGEQGLLLKYSATTGRFEALPSPYEGTFFGLLGRPDQIVAYGLRGHAYRSSDNGQTWKTIDTGTNVSLTAAASDSRGRLFLFSQAGQTLMSWDNGVRFVPQKTHSAYPIAGAATNLNGSLILVGARGTHKQFVPFRE